MKKFLVFLAAILLVFGVVGTASAVPYTWDDTVDWEPWKLIEECISVPYTHDLTDNTPVKFEPGVDSIWNYRLTVDLYDDIDPRRNRLELIYIDQPGFIGDRLTWRARSQTLGWSLAGLLDINDDGILNIEISSWYGDFYLASSTLVANGNNAVPEPATMLLLGSGLIGLAGLGRKKFFKKS